MMNFITKLIGWFNVTNTLSEDEMAFIAICNLI